MEISYSVFTRTNSGVEYPVKNWMGNEESAERWIKDHQYDKTINPYYSPEGHLTSLKYLNGLFVKKSQGIIQSRTGLTTTGKDVYAMLLYPWETKAQAVNRINHTPHYDFQLTKIY